MPCRLLIGERLRKCTAVRTASPQNVLGTPMLFIRLRAISTTDWLRRSTTPFCCGEYGVVVFLRMPSSSQYAVNSFEMNSPPRSVRSALSFAPH